ncbi:MAG: AAA family ATPase, partial [Gammaproteobacteria bacterium]|nr:AAA family ATPase [Gammaproteobacteria bacterium]
MKILKLRFKNLNSLYGEWNIDFTSPEYLSNGIFAIIGPTGSGKSTILDAICLALYGTTPRLGKITKSANGIMSRQTGECFAEVVFESSDGTYKCHWAQHRARKQADGNLAESKHEISDEISGNLLESKKRDVAQVIEQKTGMDFERFTRSILLAQGGFDTFLKADPDQRAPILEQITGTEIYSEISIRVHERQRSEKEKLDKLQAETIGIKLLTKDEMLQINTEVKEKSELTSEFDQELKVTEQSLQWLTGIDELSAEIDGINN